ncbi:MAG: F0F1 ATP synthase subunit delta [Treponema sp.]|jgi:F-type H+-transporting ATPase subunit delta|nr:F0F1 ATP synthase subunit delta [Treponema sp.]
MFHGERWASAFINTLGENADAGLACLRAMVPPVKAVPGALFGRGAGLRLERLLRDAAGLRARTDGGSGAADRADKPIEYAIRFISLLVEKDCFRHIDPLLRKIEKKLDDAKGILDVSAESASSMDSGFEENLRRMIKERTGAAGIKMRTKVVPELLGGYRLRIGGFSIDASLKGQLKKMADELAAVSSAAAGTGGLRSAGGF